jgi:hypothetical protein
MADDKRSETMKNERKMSATSVAVTALFMSVVLVGTAQSQGQPVAYKGKFTLAYQVSWCGNVLRAGDYTLTIKSTGSPMIAQVRTADGNFVTYVMNGSVSGHTHGANALLIMERGGQLFVHSLELADLGVVLIYEPSREQESVKEAVGEHAVPIMTAKK